MSNIMSDCCVKGVKHEGEPIGEYKDIGGGKCYVSYAPDKKTEHAILYLCDAFGFEFVNNRLLADSMAAAGYFVVAPDLFHGDPVPADAMKKGFSFPPWIAKHGPDVVDPVVANTIKALREEYGVKKIGAVGYCFGGRYVLRFLAKGKGLDAGFAAHPSMVSTEEIEGAAEPLSFALAETDQAFTPERRAGAEVILQKNKVVYESHLYGGTVHGFAVRTDLSIPMQKFAKESAYHQAIRWFDQWLKKGDSKPSSGNL